GAGRIYSAIEPNGDVTPCVFMPVPVGNLRRQGFQEIWVGSRLFKLLRNRDLFKGFCGRCPYRYICGGCRARAYAYFGDPLAPDPGCIYNMKEWKRVLERPEAQRVKVRL
ncbi:MAG: radical SAM/SPASM domain-containing protein, partial [Thermoprotei archaeon]